MSPEPRSYHRQWPAEVCTFASRSREGLIEQLKQLAAFLHSGLHSGPQVTLKDLAYTLNIVETVASTCRLAFVAATLAEAEERVASALERLSRPHCNRVNDPRGIYFCENPPRAEGRDEGRCAFLFPGEGSQYAGMLADVCMWFPQVRDWFDRMDRAFIDHPRGYTPSQFVFPLPGEAQQDAATDKLWQADGAVEAVFAASQAMLALLKNLKIQPDAVVGHSSGDYSALFASGAFRTAGELEFIQQAREFNRVYEEFLARGGVPEGILLAVNSPDAALLAAVIEQSSGTLHLALDNCPHQAILCGTEESTKRASDKMRDAGAICEVLPFARAYHTPAFDPVSQRLYEVLQNVELTAPEIPAYSCVTAELYPADQEEMRKLAAEQWSRPVRFRETIERMYEAGIRSFVEVGPRGNLTAFVEDILRGRPHVAVASNIAGRSGMVQIQHLVAQLFASGVPMRLDEFYARREPRSISFALTTKIKAASPAADLTLSLRLPSLQLPPQVQGAAAGSTNGSQHVVKVPIPHVVEAMPPMRAPLVSPRAQILESFFQNTTRMLDAEREVMTAFLTSRAPRRPSAPSDTPAPLEAFSLLASNLPFVRDLVSIVPGREVKVQCEIDLSEDLFLRQHTLAGKISSIDDGLVGLPVIPLTVSMEILAEVASLLAPGRVVIGMKDVRASRWLVVERERLALEITAQSTDGGKEVRVALRESPADDTAGRREAEPAVTGTVLLAPAYPPVPTFVPLELSNGRASKWQAGRMYEGTGMFHGPLFQVVSGMDYTGADGAQATFTGCSIEGFFQTKTGRQLIDPVTLDAMGQVVGYWIGDHFDTGLSVFPFRLASLDLYRGPLRAGETAKCRVRVLSIDERWMRSDIEVVAADGKPVVRMTGWEDRRLDLPRRFYDFRISPVDVFLSDPWNVPVEVLPDPEGFRCAVLEGLPEEIFEAHGSIWLLVLAYMVLSPRERQFWWTLKTSSKRRVEWLLGRIVAKDAVRRLLRETAGLKLCPADIEIAADPSGVPAVRGRWAKDGGVPAVSISHSGGLTIAVAGRSSKSLAVGADVEQIGRITAEVERLVLSAGERELLAAMDEETRAEWATRLWCAKEAVGKALGRGVFAGSAELQVSGLDIPTGRVSVSVSEEMALRQPHNGSVVAYTGAEGAHAFGTALV
jgi:malonyl CoA-acyl carrier protein transacylase/phosphopantetheinyl transferase